ncbi:hypothetical protein GCM10023187_44990 [Nibrella viscosa]|uniref:Lantibiotic biosynthesis protein dehydration domain-containing protein n=1 Tax=Nibrella viscosa TaxID=1084524 RepID=A0ABP8KU02_9BACT
MNQAPYKIKEQLKAIPFVEIVLPYTEFFISKADLKLLPWIQDKLECKLLEELSYTAEVTLYAELNKFIASGETDFEQFVERMVLSLATNYPVLDKKLRVKSRNFSNHIHNIITRFQKDVKSIESTFNLKSIEIVDIDLCIGDMHNGEGTSSVSLSDGTKLIYKPRNVGITHSYNSFINWVNCKVKADLKTFNVLDCGGYGWIEFVNYEPVSSEDDLREYYYKAGVLLAVTLLLGSKDCHHENLIASGKNPVIIDHETIIQPVFNDKSFRSWNSQFNIPDFSVLESVLIVNQDTGAPLNNVGYGVLGHVDVTDLDRVVINPNTLYSKISTRVTTRKIGRKNIPVFKGKYHFVNDYKENFIDGFSVAYDVFLSSKVELKSGNSPLKFFISNEMRYVWRPTFIYFKILKYLRLGSFMANYQVYQSTLYDLLSKAFKGENREDYKFILDYEVKQMLNGDIPIFNLKSEDDFLVDNKLIKIFEYNCIQNIFHRIDLLSDAHKEEQIRFIRKWVNI